MATSLTLQNDPSSPQGYLKVNGTTAATVTENGLSMPQATIGSLNGILKATSGVVTAATAGTDYLTSTSGGSITLDTAKTASGTSVDFTSIPSWVKRITVMFSGVSTNGTSVIQVQIGSGAISNSSYSATASYGSGSSLYLHATTGFILDTANTVGITFSRSGILQLSLINSNTWVASGNISTGSVGQTTLACAGTSPALVGSLDRVRITTVNGTDAFDTGTINISYQ